MKNDLPSARSAITAGVVMALGVGLITAGVLAGASDRTDGDQPFSAQAARLVSYDSCDLALSQLKSQALPHVGAYGFNSGSVPYGLPGEMRAGPQIAAPMAGADSKAEAPAPPDHSGTNVQEAGVDEPDLVKTDGERVVSVTDGFVRVVDVASHKQTAKIQLANGSTASQLLLDGDRALVMTSTAAGINEGRIAPAVPDVATYGTQLDLVDLSGAGRVLGTLSVDGAYLDGRQVGDVARIVVHSAPHLQFRYPENTADPHYSLSANKDVVENSSIQDWLPRYELTAGGATSSGQLTACDDVSHPADYTATGMLTVLTVDLTKDLGTGEPVTIVADGDTVYGTAKNLYVADDHAVEGIAAPQTPGGRTDLYQFDIAKPGKPAYVASGEVDGSLLNQYSLSEYQDNLRVATTTAGPAGTESRITVLTCKGNQLTTVGAVSGLGTTERIYAVRFIDDQAYVVTFKQTDPLYTVDLSDPAAPKVTGQLQLTGYSAYLHPAGDGRLIGVGQEATATGRVQGAQVSLFDTSNPAGAARIAQYRLADGFTEVDNDPHAFLYWPDKDLLVLPFVDGSAGPQQQRLLNGALVLRLKDNSFTQAGVISHQSDQYGNESIAPSRSMVIGNELWTVSEAGLMANDLDSLSQRAWIPFT